MSGRGRQDRVAHRSCSAIAATTTAAAPARSASSMWASTSAVRGDPTPVNTGTPSASSTAMRITRARSARVRYGPDPVEPSTAIESTSLDARLEICAASARSSSSSSARGVRGKALSPSIRMVSGYGQSHGGADNAGPAEARERADDEPLARLGCAELGEARDALDRDDDRDRLGIPDDDRERRRRALEVAD